MFDQAFPVARVRAAEYNPRAITPDAIEALKASIRDLGFAKPIIVKPDGLTIAGHQRSRAARELGLEHVPAWVIPDVGVTDEVRFNQLHNGTDLELEEPVRVPPADDFSIGGFFEDVPGESVEGDLRSSGAAVRSEICRLVLRYGPWGCAVATESGEVVSAGQYALACKMLGKPCRVYRIPDDKADQARAAFARRYGEFSYDHLPRTTYLQSYAQPYRLRGGDRGTSQLYEDHVLPALKKTERALDFGCGQGDYVKHLKSQGYQITGVEFFRRMPPRSVATKEAWSIGAIDAHAVNGMIDELVTELREHGRFDVVILDAVITSTDTRQAENDVLTCLNAFCKPGSRVYISGRRRESVDQWLRSTKRADKTESKRYIEFVDKDGWTGLYRFGAWFFQRFHTQEQAREIALEYFGDESPTLKQSGGMWQMALIKERAAQNTEDAIAREFDLPWPSGRRVGRARDAVEAYCEALKRG